MGKSRSMYYVLVERGFRVGKGKKRETVYDHHQGLSLFIPSPIVNHKKGYQKAWNQRNLQTAGVSTLFEAGVEGGVNLVFSFTTVVQLRDSDMGPPALSKAITARYSILVWKMP